VVLFDVLLPVDKFTAADVMREVTIYDTIEPTANYSAKVHSLATFHAGGRLEEIDDPLYGSSERGGADEVAAVTAAATLLASCCEARRAAERAVRSGYLCTLLMLTRSVFFCAGAGGCHRGGGAGCGRGGGRGGGGVAGAARGAAPAADGHGPHGLAAPAHAQPPQLK